MGVLKTFREFFDHSFPDELDQEEVIHFEKDGLEWTKEKPNPEKDSWYWIRSQGAKNGDGNPGTKIVRFIKTSFGVFAYGFGAVEDIENKEFAGPIPEPGEE